MKHLLNISIIAMLLAVSSVPAFAKGRRASSSKPQVIYTGEIAKKVIGYNGTTPLNITIVDGRISNIEALPNNETPKYFNRACEKIFPQYIGLTVRNARSLNPDIATGATYSSKAIIENIRAGLQQAGSTKRDTPAKSSGKKRMTRK